MKITPVLQPVIMSLLSLNKVSSSSSLSSSVLSYFSLPSSSSSSHHSYDFLNIINLSFSRYVSFPLTFMVVFSVFFEDYWISLSDEIILAIFQLLPKKAIVKCARVCKHWHRLV